MQWLKSFFAPSLDDQILEVKMLGRRMENQAVRLRNKAEEKRKLLIASIAKGDLSKARIFAEALMQYETIAQKCEQVKLKVDYFICYARTAPAAQVFAAFDVINNTSEKMDDKELRYNFMGTYNSLHAIGMACMPMDGQWARVITTEEVKFLADKLVQEEVRRQNEPKPEPPAPVIIEERKALLAE